MAMDLISSEFQKAVLKTLEARVEQMKEEFIKARLKEFEKTLRFEVSKATIDLTKYFDIQKFGDNLVITIRDIYAKPHA